MIYADNYPADWQGLKKMTMKKALEGDIYMVYTESAHIIDPIELKAIIENEEYSNPTVERLMFIETKKNERFPGKVFPCYLEAWGYDPETKNSEDPEILFQCCIMQCTGGEFSLVRVVISEKEIGVTRRFWDKPPTKGLRDFYPFPEEGEQ